MYLDIHDNICFLKEIPLRKCKSENDQGHPNSFLIFASTTVVCDFEQKQTRICNHHGNCNVIEQRMQYHIYTYNNDVGIMM